MAVHCYTGRDYDVKGLYRPAADIATGGSGGAPAVAHLHRVATVSTQFEKLSLDAPIDQLQPQHFSFRTAVIAACRAIHTIDFMHKNRRAHLNISPRTIVWKRSSKNGSVDAVVDEKLCANLQSTSLKMGFYHYVPATAPELLKTGNAPQTLEGSVAADIYALGFMFFHLFATQDEYPVWTTLLQDFHDRRHSISPEEAQILQEQIYEKIKAFLKNWNSRLVARSNLNQQAQIVCAQMMAFKRSERISLEKAVATLIYIQNRAKEEEQAIATVAQDMASSLQHAYFENACLLVPRMKNPVSQLTQIQTLYEALQQDFQRHPIARETLFYTAVAIVEEAAQFKACLTKKDPLPVAPVKRTLKTGHTLFITPSDVFIIAAPSDPVFEEYGTYKRVRNGVRFPLLDFTAQSTPIVLATITPSGNHKVAYIEDIEREIANHLRLQELYPDASGSIVPLLFTHKDQESYYCIYERYQENLSEMDVHHPRFSLRDKVEAAIGALTGLMQMHDKKIAHFDVKSGNMLCKRLKDGSIKAVLSDFGFSCDISKQQSKSFRFQNGSYGTIDQTPSEVLQARPFAPENEEAYFLTDVYAMGFSLFPFFSDEVCNWKEDLWWMYANELYTGADILKERLKRQVLIFNKMSAFDKKWSDIAQQNSQDPLIRAAVLCSKLMTLQPTERLPLATALAEFKKLHGALPLSAHTVADRASTNAAPKSAPITLTKAAVATENITRLKNARNVVPLDTLRIDTATSTITYTGYAGTLYSEHRHFLFREKVEAAMGAISAILQMHEKKIAHFHITLDTFRCIKRENGTLYVAVAGLEFSSDFSPAQPLPKSFQAGLYLNPAASAPEVCQSEEYEPQTIEECFYVDIYALGFELFHLFSTEEERPKWAAILQTLSQGNVQDQARRETVVKEMQLFIERWSTCTPFTSHQKAQMLCAQMMAIDPRKRPSLKEAYKQFQHITQEMHTRYESLPKSYLDLLLEEHKNPLAALVIKVGQPLPEPYRKIQTVYLALQTKLQRSWLHTRDVIDMSLDIMKEKGKKDHTIHKVYLDSRTLQMVSLNANGIFVLAKGSDPIVATAAGSRQMSNGLYFDFAVPDDSFSGTPVIQTVRTVDDEYKTVLINQEIKNHLALKKAPNVLKLVSGFMEEKKATLIYESYDGTLQDFCDFPTRFSLLNRLEAALGAISGIRQMHGIGICHFNISLHNLMYKKRKDRRIKAVISNLGASVDFSLAKSQQKIAKDTWGSIYKIVPGFPDKVTSQEAFRCDLYALGHALFALFAKDMELFEHAQKKLADTTPSDPILQAQIICKKMMAIAPRDRLPLSMAHKQFLSIYTAVLKK